MFEAFTMLRALHFLEGKDLKMRERAARCCPLTAQSRPGKPIPLFQFQFLSFGPDSSRAIYYSLSVIRRSAEIGEEWDGGSRPLCRTEPPLEM